MKRAQADVLIVGGGFMGAATAFFLRRRGKSVILLERQLIGQQASGTNFGNVRRQGRLLAQLPLANRSREIWLRMPELIGHDAEFLMSGHLRVCYRSEQADMFETYAREAKHYNLDLEMLHGDALRKRFPFIGPEVLAGSYAPIDGHANPRLAAPAFGRAAAKLGAQIFENTDIVSVEKEGNEFRATSADGRTFHAPVLLITAGAWGSTLSEQFGEPVPIAVHGPQMAVTEPVPYSIAPAVGVSSPQIAEVVYFRQVARGNIVIGGCARGPAFLDARRAKVLPHSTLLQFRQAQRVAPALKRLNIIRVWSGVEGYMPDDRPIMGASGTTSGLFYAFGFCGHGFQLGPGVGDTMAELIDTGGTSTPIEPFDIRRFAAFRPPAGSSQSAQQSVPAT
ncbi:MAG: FAD-binding oxidoreductase [Paraburkholderia tropica]|uniref:Glycine/D-amino acid oxidase-like deaminating enzyme n=1 Tax=Paraburkholderia tropica TaxID=92647 RepID=A0ABX5MN81_9BURK|nr:FAD-binding oxidoreductase [Paraburkholderia tropica]MDE1144925.1 FAD-binding oxidoreductase [Paraburkholderia tropica]PXX15684.1 glycine/D-amino acid oxidase-like deaminating enzyme [Paraburkholderia tropica]PZW81943.1 glycine/D-amino acid oxidase-like deaminating enzyme [Paraburkholderia tropica]